MPLTQPQSSLIGFEQKDGATDSEMHLFWHKTQSSLVLQLLIDSFVTVFIVDMECMYCLIIITAKIIPITIATTPNFFSRDFVTKLSLNFSSPNKYDWFSRVRFFYFKWNSDFPQKKWNFYGSIHYCLIRSNDFQSIV